MSPRPTPVPPTQTSSPAQDGTGVFEFVCGELERRAGVSRAVARGTVRLGMRQAQLSAETLDKHNMSMMVRGVLPAMLARRHVRNAETLCKMIAKVLEVSPAADFRRPPSLAPPRRPSRATPSTATKTRS